jgi:hypothetical protein
MSLTAANALISIQDGILAPVNLAAGDIGLFTPGNDLIFALQSTKWIQRAEFTLIAPGYPGLHQQSFSWQPGQYNGWRIPFPASTLVSDASVLAGISLVVTVTDSSSSSITANNFLESKGGGAGGGAGTILAFTTSALSAGDGITGANSASTADNITKALPAALLNTGKGWGVALFPALANTFTLYAGVGATVPGSLIGLTATGAKAYAVLDTNARVIRSLNPEPADYVIGEIDPNANLHIDPFIRFGGTIVIGSPGYECDRTGNIDTSAVVQKALDDAYNPALAGLPYNMRPVHFPRGRYRLVTPVQIKQSGAVIGGDGMYSSYLDAASMGAGPGLHASNYQLPMPPIVGNGFASLAKSIHIETNLATNNEPFMKFREFGMGVDVDGFTEFTVEMMVWVDPATPEGGVLFSSAGKRFPSDPAIAPGAHSNAFMCTMDGSNSGCSTRVHVSTTGYVNANFAPSGAWTGFPKGQWVWFEFNVGRGFMRTFVNGWKLSFLTAVGSIVQADWESVNLGVGFSDFFGTGFSNVVATANIGYLRVSKTVRNQFDGSANYTQVYTPPTVPPPIDGLTTLMADFQITSGAFNNYRAIITKASALPAVETSWPQHWAPTSTQAPYTALSHIEISNLNIFSPAGPALELQTVNESIIHDLSLIGKTGVFCENNCFNLYLKRIYAAASTPDLARIGINMGDSAYESSADDCRITAFRYGLLCLSATVIQNGYYIDNTQYGILAITAANLVVNGLSISDEGGGFVNPLSSIGLIRCGAVTISGCSLLVATGTGPVIHAEDGIIFFHRCDITFPGTSLGWHGPFTSPVAPGNYCFDMRIIDPNYAMSVHAPTFEASFNSFGVFPGVEALIITPTSTADIEWNIMPRAVFKKITIPMADANQAITADQYLSGKFIFTGALTANRTVTVPLNPTGMKTFFNNTTGGFSVIVKTTTGAVTNTIPAAATWGMAGDGAELRHIT